MPKLTFVGVGEAFDPRLPNTSVLYRGSRALLIDCGYSVPQALWRLTTDPSLLDGVFLTHHHADHAFGLPGLLMWMRTAGRTRPLGLMGGPGSNPWIRDVLELGYPGAYAPHKCFGIEQREIATEVPTTWGPLLLTTAQSRHSLANHSLRVEDQNAVFCHSGDGSPTPACLALYRNATVVVHECYSSTGKHPSHGSAEALLEQADELRIGTLCLVHLEASPTEKAAVHERVRTFRGRTRVLLPQPGDNLEF